MFGNLLLSFKLSITFCTSFKRQRLIRKCLINAYLSYVSMQQGTKGPVKKKLTAHHNGDTPKIFSPSTSFSFQNINRKINQIS